MGIKQFKIPGVIHHPAHQVTGLLVVKVSQVHPFQFVIGPGTQIAHQVPGRLMRQVIAQKTEQDPEQVQSHQYRSQRTDLPQARFIHSAFHDPRHGGKGFRCGQVHRCQAQCRQDRDNI